MYETSNYDFKLMDFSDTMGDQAIFNNYNFEKLDTEIQDIESILEEYIGEDVFEEAQSLSETLDDVKNKYGATQILRGTQKTNLSDLFVTNSSWIDSAFTSSQTSLLSLVEFQNSQISSQGRPVPQLSHYLNCTGHYYVPAQGEVEESGENITFEMRQNNIPLMNNTTYTVSFFAKKSEAVLGTTQYTGDGVTLYADLTDHGVAADQTHTVLVDSTNWKKYTITLTLPQVIEDAVLDVSEATESLGSLKDLAIGAESTLGLCNTIQICGLQLSRGVFTHDWNISPSDLMDYATEADITAMFAE